jgi:hypothetical protein
MCGSLCLAPSPADLGPRAVEVPPDCGTIRVVRVAAPLAQMEPPGMLPRSVLRNLSADLRDAADREGEEHCERFPQDSNRV